MVMQTVLMMERLLVQLRAWNWVQLTETLTEASLGYLSEDRMAMQMVLMMEICWV